MEIIFQSHIKLDKNVQVIKLSLTFHTDEQFAVDISKMKNIIE